MSTINTNSIDSNYPVPGQNNSTQGFRNNFAAIKQNLNIASSEITDLQNKVVLKTALANSTLNNDMGNTLISNASTLGFRATTYNLGNALTDTVTVDLTLGDVQYGNLAGNIFLNFGSWAPTDTASNVTLQLGRPNNVADFSITFPTEAVFNENYGWTLVENSSNPNSLATLTFPYDCTQLNLLISTVDCGNTLFVTPLNRPFQTNQLQKRTPPSTGQLGDVVGTTCIDNIVATQLTVSSTSDNYFITTDTSELYPGLPIVFTAGSVDSSTEPNVTLGTTYYISNVANSTAFQISAVPTASGLIDLAGNTSTMKVNPISYMYVAVDNFSASNLPQNKNVDSTTAPNVITVGSVMTGKENMPVIFTGDGLANANIQSGKVYYIKSVSTYDITLSETRYNGIAGPTFEGVQTFVTTSNLPIDFDVYNGPDIFRRIPLLPENLPSPENVDDTVNGNLTVTQNMFVAGNANIQTNISVTGNAQAQNISLLGNANISNNLTVSNIIVSGQIVNGNSNILISTNAISMKVNGIANAVVFSNNNVALSGDTTISGNATITGNLIVAGNYVYENVTSLAIEDPIISLGRNANNTPLTSSSLADRGTQLWYYDSVANVEKAAFIGYDISQQKLIAATDVINSSEVITVSNYGTFKVGTLEATNFTTENLSVSNAWVNVNIPTVNDIHIGGGLNGYYLVTDGSGNLSWVSGGGSGNGTVGGSNTQIQFNNSGSFNGSANLTWDDSTSVLTIAGDVNTSGNISGNNISINNLAANNTTLSGNISANFIVLSVNNGVTATGSDQSTAALITKSINVVTTVPTGSGVKLPAAVEGLRIIIRNSTSNSVLVYPNTNASIEPALPNFPYTLNAITSMEFFCSTGGAAGQWFTLM